MQAEAAWALGNVRQANELFRAAIQADEKQYRPRVRWGRLYLETHQYSDAADLFREALEINGDDVQARLGMARLLSDQFDGDARTVVNEVIEKNDSERDRVQANALIEAHLLSARMDLDDGKHGSAEKSLQKAADLAEEQKQPPLEALRAARRARPAEGRRQAQQLATRNPTAGSHARSPTTRATAAPSKRWLTTRSCVVAIAKRTAGCRRLSPPSPIAGPRKPSSA